MTASVQEFVERVEQVREEAVSALADAASPEELEQLRIRYLGKKGELKLLLKGLKDVPGEAKRDAGAAVNAAKEQVEEALSAGKERLADAGSAAETQGLDVTLPGIRTRRGALHPVTTTLNELKRIFVGLGYSYDDFPELETEYYNFDSLNQPEWHPARDMHDTFYTEGDRLVRTHCTAYQVRAMRSSDGPPIRAITAGRCYRRDTVDKTHFPIFHQIDAFAVDRNITFADLKWTLENIAHELFGPEARVRFRPSYFPFTTPSAEVDVFFAGKWIEILGCGMMRPEVLREGGLDPEIYQGFAMGIGVDRIAMRRHHIEDIRDMYMTKEAFLRQF